MKILDVQQGSPEWFRVRAGIPTASCFGKIITPGGKPSKSADKYLDECLAEYLAGDDLSEDNSSFWMQRGTELEDEARKQYAFITGETVKQVGFCLQGGVGCSPDGLVGDSALVEIKCPKPATIVSYYRDGFPNTYKPQIQAQLWITDRKRCDFFAYHPAMKPYFIAVYRDDEYIMMMGKIIGDFLMRLGEEKDELIGYKV